MRLARPILILNVVSLWHSVLIRFLFGIPFHDPLSVFWLRIEMYPPQFYVTWLLRLQDALKSSCNLTEKKKKRKPKHNISISILNCENYVLHIQHFASFPTEWVVLMPKSFLIAHFLFPIFLCQGNMKDSKDFKTSTLNVCWQTYIWG